MCGDFERAVIEVLSASMRKKVKPEVVVISAPQGKGKSRHAELLRVMFDCACVVEDWDGHSPVPAGALVLTNLPVGEVGTPVVKAKVRKARLPFSSKFFAYECDCPDGVSRMDCPHYLAACEAGAEGDPSQPASSRQG